MITWVRQNRIWAEVVHASCLSYRFWCLGNNMNKTITIIWIRPSDHMSWKNCVITIQESFSMLRGLRLTAALLSQLSLMPPPFLTPLHTTPPYHSPSPLPLTTPPHHSPLPLPLTTPPYHSPSPLPLTNPPHHSPSPLPLTTPPHRTPPHTTPLNTPHRSPYPSSHHSPSQLLTTPPQCSPHPNTPLAIPPHPSSPPPLIFPPHHFP